MSVLGSRMPSHLHGKLPSTVNEHEDAHGDAPSQAAPTCPRAETETPCPASVANLLLRIQQQDRPAYSQLYGLYRRRLHGYAAQLLHCEQAADDIVQEVFDRIWRYSSSFDAGRMRHPDGWIFQIARNQAMTELARRARLAELDSVDESETSAWHAAPWDDGDHLLDLAALNSARERLPSVYRQVVFLRFQLDLSLQEIAEHLGIPVGTAKTWLRRALIALREQLGVHAPALQDAAH